MQNRSSIELNPEDKMEQKNGSQNSVQLTAFPDELLLTINNYVSSVKDKAHLASVNLRFHGLFQPEIGKKEANEAEEYAILPTNENVETLKAFLKACPALLRHPVTVKNRHGMMIKGTVYQIALHEGDNELIDDVIKPAFERLHDDLETMEEQRKTWLPDGWMKAEEKSCESALTAIDKVFTAFKNASNPNDVTELPQHPYTMTINNQEVSKALKAFRKAVDAFYHPTDKVITSGRDPIIKLLERVINRYEENYEILGGYDTPRNNALLRSVVGYCQRSAPINFMQAFAMGTYYIVEKKKKLIRSFEYRNWSGHTILPLDLDPNFRLGYEYYGDACSWMGDGAWRGEWSRRQFQNFLSIKNSSYTSQVLCIAQPKVVLKLSNR